MSLLLGRPNRASRGEIDRTLAARRRFCGPDPVFAEPALRIAAGMTIAALSKHTPSNRFP